MPDPISGAAATPLPTHTTELVDTGVGQVDPSLLDTSPASGFDQDMFLELLVAQLRYQDPLSPMDGSDLMAQTAQLTTVEKLNELTDALDASLSNDRLGTATGFIGRDVTYTGLDGLSRTDRVTGVRLAPTGPVLILGDTEVAMGQVEQVSSPR